MDSSLAELASLIAQRNATEIEISRIIGRPASIGHIGEYLASHIFDSALHRSATYKGQDGVFRSGPFAGRSVNVKWYARDEGLLDLNSAAIPDYFLVLAGPRSAAMSSRGGVRPWLIEQVFLFDGHLLHSTLSEGTAKIGIATSVRRHLWDASEIYPHPTNTLLKLNNEQRALLALFRQRETATLRGTVE